MAFWMVSKPYALSSRVSIPYLHGTRDLLERSEIAMNIRVIVFCSILLFSVPLLAREKSDVIVMHNGDRFTGEIKGLDSGVLYVSFDYIDGTSSIQWSKVRNLESKQLFVVKTEDGSVISGTLIESWVIRCDSRDSGVAESFSRYAHLQKILGVKTFTFKRCCPSRTISAHLRAGPACFGAPLCEPGSELPDFCGAVSMRILPDQTFALDTKSSLEGCARPEQHQLDKPLSARFSSCCSRILP
jgi:hypothetical protein